MRHALVAEDKSAKEVIAAHSPPCQDAIECDLGNQALQCAADGVAVCGKFKLPTP